jgi:hypothetical protein
MSRTYKYTLAAQGMSGECSHVRVYDASGGMELRASFPLQEGEIGCAITSCYLGEIATTTAAAATSATAGPAANAAGEGSGAGNGVTAADGGGGGGGGGSTSMPGHTASSSQPVFFVVGVHCITCAALVCQCTCVCICIWCGVDAPPRMLCPSARVLHLYIRCIKGHHDQPFYTHVYACQPPLRDRPLHHRASITRPAHMFCIIKIPFGQRHVLATCICTHAHIRRWAPQ